MVLVIGTVGVIWCAGELYPDQVFSASLQIPPLGLRSWSSAETPRPSFMQADGISPMPGQSLARFVVLPASAAMPMANDGMWQPTTADIAGLDAALQQISRLKAENRRTLSNRSP
jgi:hypothetical protein